MADSGLCSTLSLECTAYSYSAKRQRVLLEGRTALLGNGTKNPAQVETAMSMLQPEIAYLEAHHGAGFHWLYPLR